LSKEAGSHLFIQVTFLFPFKAAWANACFLPSPAGLILPISPRIFEVGAGVWADPVPGKVIKSLLLQPVFDALEAFSAGKM